MQVGGQIIRTTGEHPLYVVDQGWIAAKELEEGDLLQTEDKRSLPVQKVSDTGKVETVYNFRVAEYHTYFVGCEAWGFSVWVHNAKVGYKNGYRTADRKFASPTGKRMPAGRTAVNRVAKNLAKDGYEVVGREMVFTSKSGQRRSYDLVVRKNDKFYAVEVKSGSATKTKPQRTFDSQNLGDIKGHGRATNLKLEGVLNFRVIGRRSPFAF